MRLWVRTVTVRMERKKDIIGFDDSLYLEVRENRESEIRVWRFLKNNKTLRKEN